MISIFNSCKISFLLILFIIPSIVENQAINQTVTRKVLTEDKNFQLASNSSFKDGSDGRETKHIIVATLENAPFMMRSQISRNNTTVLEWYGYCMDLFNELTKHLPYKVTYEIYQVADNRYGSKSKQIVLNTKNETGDKSTHSKLEKWSGLIGDLQQGKAHLALAPLAVMAERELAVDFTVPFYDLVGIQILLKKPEVPQDWFKFLTVLDGEVWFSITVAYFVTSFVIFLFDRLSPYSHKNLARIRRLRQNRKNHLELDELDILKSTKKPRTMFPLQYTNSLDEINQPDGSLIAGEHLGKSHQLYVGSLGNTTLEAPRRPTFLLTGFDSFGKSKSSVHPLDSPRPDEWRQDHRGSKTMNDYFHSIKLKSNDITEHSKDPESDDSDNEKPDFGLRDSLWFCITSLTPQGGGEAPQNLSGRVVAGAWWLFCFIIIASYTANLAAFLTVSRLDIPIENLDDLVKQYKIKYAPVDGTAEQTYFERMAYIEEIFYNIWKDMSLNSSLSEEERSKFAVWDYPISDKYTKIWTQIQQVGLPVDIEAGIKRVKNSNLDDGFALLADANLVKHAVMTDCSFKSVGDEFSRKPIALGVRKGDEQFRDDLSYAILKLINQRYMETLREKWWTNNPNRILCDNNDESEGISIENIGGVFIIIFVGVAISFFVWAIERFVYKTKIGVSKELIQEM